MSLDYITADELAEIMRSDKIAGKDYLVVDVRDNDFKGGNIRGCLNRPSASFGTAVEDLVKSSIDIPTVIFTCVSSRGRGPRLAKKYQETKESLDQYKDLPQEVLVLNGGFANFLSKFKGDTILVENLDSNA